MIVLGGIKGMKLVWLHMKVNKSVIKVISPSGNHINVSFKQSKEIEGRKLNNTFRIIRKYSSEGWLKKLHVNEVKIQCCNEEMKELLRVSKI